MLKNPTFAAAETKDFQERNDFFRILSTTVGPVDIKFYRQGSEVADASGVSAGYSEKFETPFDLVKITSPSAQAVQFVMRYGSEVGFDSQSIQTSPLNGGHVHTAPAIATATTQILAAKANRRYLLVQNNDAGSTIWIRGDGTAATTAPPSIKLGPGGSYENAEFPPTGAVNAISAGAANPLVTVVEG